MPDLRRVHSFRDHPFPGVNWRPTRFVDEVPSSRVCALCRMISTRTVVLPCSHILCQSCHEASFQGCVGWCPLHQEPFEEAECFYCDFSTRKQNSFKVHCWNEAYGCKFEGAVELVLRHYENECTFHTVDCLRCGEQVLHRELSTHYVAGCGAAVSLAGRNNASSISREMNIQDVTAALQELKMLLRNDHKQLLLAIQCSNNEVIQQIRSQESKCAVFPHNVAAPVRTEMDHDATPSPSTSLQEGTSGQNPTEDASTSAASSLQETATPHNVAAPVNAEMAQVGTPSPSTLLQESTAPENSTEDASTSAASSLKKAATPENAESFADIPEGVLKAMRNTSSQDYPKHAITYLLKGVKCQLELKGPLSTTRTWTAVREVVTYVVTLKNVPTHMSLRERNIAYMMVLHTRDSYFTVQLYVYQSNLGIVIQFHGIHHGLTFRAPLFKLDLSQTFPAGSYGHGRDCECYAIAEATCLRTDSEIQTEQTRQICLLHRNIKFDIRMTPQ